MQYKCIIRYTYTKECSHRRRRRQGEIGREIDIAAW